MICCIWLKIIKNYNIEKKNHKYSINAQKLPTSARTDAAPDARLLVCLVKPSRKGFI